MEEYLRGVLGFKGDTGLSAYELALKNGFVGTEKDWLATLGTSSHFNEESIIYTSTAGQTSFNLPNSYTSNSFIDVYVNGLRLNSNEYTKRVENLRKVISSKIDDKDAYAYERCISEMYKGEGFDFAQYTYTIICLTESD